MVITNRLKDTYGSVERTISVAFDENRRRVDRNNEYSSRLTHSDMGCVGCYQKDNRLLIKYDNRVDSKPEKAGQTKNQTDDASLASKTTLTFYDEKQLEENWMTKSWTADFGFLPQYIGLFPYDRFPTKFTLGGDKEQLLTSSVGNIGLLAFHGALDARQPFRWSVNWSGLDENADQIAVLESDGFSE